MALPSLRNNSPKRLKVSLPVVMALLFGFCLGLMVGMMQHRVATTTSDISTSSSVSSSRRLPVSSPSDNDGWHDVHVFYGDREALLRTPAESNQPWFAQVHQDEVVVDLLGKKGYFIDLAANDAKEWSNTLSLERYHEWNGLCVEPNPTYWYGLSHRKCTVVGALVGRSVEKVNVKFRGVFGGIVGKMDEKLAKRKHEPDAQVEQRYTAPLLDVFRRFNVPHTIDYLSLDVEGAEFLIMKDFPFSEYKIRIMTIERPTKPLKKLLEDQGYMHLRDFAWWGETLWAHKSEGLTKDHPKIQKIPYDGKN